MGTSEAKALVKVDAPRTAGGIALAAALEQEKEQCLILHAFVKDAMKEGVDYGRIPGVDKMFLWKPGAEKLTSLFRCTPKFGFIAREENFERGFFNYILRTRLTARDSDAVLAEGMGSCNSYEGKYRYRTANRKCPACGKETIIKGKAEYGGGWVCWQKGGGGCKAKFADGDQSIEGQPQGKVENEDRATLANTILKMAKKRAHVDAAIALAGVSDMFTQDEEAIDMSEVAAPPPPPAQAAAVPQKPEAKPQPKQEASAPPAEVKAPKKAKQAPELRNRIVRLWRGAMTKGAKQEAFEAWAAHVLGRKVASTEWDATDLERLEGMQQPQWVVEAPREVGQEG